MSRARKLKGRLPLPALFADDFVEQFVKMSGAVGPAEHVDTGQAVLDHSFAVFRARDKCG